MATKITTFNPLEAQQSTGYDSNKLNVQDLIEIKTVVNANADDLANKENVANKTTDLVSNDDAHYPSVKAVNTAIASKVSLNDAGLVDPAVLPVVVFSGLSGSGTINDPYIVQGGGSGGLSADDLTAYFKALPGWAPDRFLAGNLQWIDPPTGEVLEKLQTPVISFSAPAGDAVHIYWTFVPNGLTYTLQRDISNTFVNAVTLFSGYGDSYFDVGLDSVTTYYYRVKATASGYFGSNYGTNNITTDVAGNVTPAAPTAPVTNDVANTFNWTNTVGYSIIGQYEYTLDGGNSYTTCTVKPLQIGDISKPVGSIGVRIAAASGVNFSQTLFNAVAFHKVVQTPAKPTNPITDDSANTFDWTYVTGWALPELYEYTTDSGSSYQTVPEKPLPVGDNSFAVGSVGVRVKAVADTNNPSPTLFNTIAFYATPVDNTTAINTWELNFAAIVDQNEANTILLDPSYTNAPFGVAVPHLKVLPLPINATLVCDARSTFPGTGTIGLDTVDGSVSNPANIAYSLQFQDNTDYGRKVINNHGESAYISTAISLDVIKIRIRVDGLNLYYEYTANSGGLWQQCGTTVILPASTTLYAKAVPENNLGFRNCFNVRQYGFIGA